jgi:predicted ATPase
VAAPNGNIINSNAHPVTDVGGVRVVLDLGRYRSVFQDLAKSVYLGAFRNAVNVGGNSDYYDLQIGQAFIAQWDSYKTGQNRAQNRVALAVENELRQIFGLRSLQINAAPGNETLQVIADSEPYQLAEQGAGLAQFIVVLAFIATRRPPYVFIDEPEQNLHPSLQLDFLTTLAKYTTHGVVFATHNIGLARAVAREVYSVRRLPDASREVRQLAATRNYGEFLGELSLSGYEELGFKQVLLVEGTTEVPTLQSWLRLYGVEHQVVIVPLGGASLINGRSGQSLAEIKRITTHVAVLIDSERNAAGAQLARDRQVFVEKCEELGFSIHVLERRALENYLTAGAIRSVKGKGYSALGHFELLKDHSPAWGKNENWRIAAKMTRPDLEATDLGAFLNGLGDGADN